jgi:hypothetical protein
MRPLLRAASNLDDVNFQQVLAQLMQHHLSRAPKPESLLDQPVAMLAIDARLQSVQNYLYFQPWVEPRLVAITPLLESRQQVLQVTRHQSEFEADLG